MRKTENKSGRRDNLFAVILVGGKGKRLMPLSTEAKPKAFLSVTKDRKTLFKNTLDRALGLFQEENIMVVANRAHSSLVMKDFRAIGRGHLITEPYSRNTAPAIALAVKLILSKYGNSIIAVLPCDQYIKEKVKYLSSIKKGIDFVKNHKEAIVVLGLKPKSASTQLGYIKIGKGESLRPDIYKVEKFTEKPDLETADKYFKSGRYLWNAGVFIFRASTFLKALDKFMPELANALKKMNGNMRRYDELPDISIDYAVIEKADNIYCVKGAYDWYDIGNFDNLKKVLVREKRKFVTLGGKITKIL